LYLDNLLFTKVEQSNNNNNNNNTHAELQLTAVFITSAANPRRTIISSKHTLFVIEPLPFSIWEV